MNIFIKKTIFFIIIGLSTSYITDIVYSYVFRPQGGQSSWNDIYNDNINSDIIFFGTSRAQYHIVSSIITDSTNISVYNLGLSAARTEIQIIRLKEFLAHCTHKPKRIFLEVGPFLINSAEFIDYNYCFFMLFNKDFLNYTTQLQNQYEWTDIYFPMKRYSGHFLNHIRNYLKRDDKDSCYRGFYNPWKKWVVGEGMQRNITKFDIHPLRVKYLNEFIQLCIDNHIEVSMIYTPENHLINYTNKQEIINLFQATADSFGIEFKDFSKDSIPINTDTLYYHDVFHLTSDGAIKFTSENLVPYIKELYKL